MAYSNQYERCPFSIFVIPYSRPDMDSDGKLVTNEWCQRSAVTRPGKVMKQYGRCQVSNDMAEPVNNCSCIPGPANDGRKSAQAASRKTTQCFTITIHIKTICLGHI